MDCVDCQVPSVKRRKTCESAARLFDSPLIDAAAAAADVDDDDDDVDDDDNDDDDDLCSEMTETDASQVLPPTSCSTARLVHLLHHV